MSLHLFAGLRVKDFAAARPWYEQIFGAPSFFPNDIEAVWTLGDGQMLYIVEHPEAGHSVVTIMVDDLDERLDKIALEPTFEETYDNGVRKVTFTDPDGNEVAFGSVPPT